MRQVGYRMSSEGTQRTATCSAGCLAMALCSMPFQQELVKPDIANVPVCERSNPVDNQNVFEVYRWERSTYHVHPLSINRIDRNDSLHGIVRFPREII